MSWLFGSLQSNPDSSSPPSPSLPEQLQQRSPTSRSGGVKDDLSVIGDTIGRQLRGVANFLAPPPSASPAEEKSLETFDSSSSSQAFVGLRNDLAEIGGTLKSGFSLLSSNKAVSEISKFTSNLLQFQDNNEGDDDDYAPGITEEVIDFVKEISRRPECWTDFPFSIENDFRMSDAQREHASTIELMVPSFTDLRANLHNCMGEDQFWMIYFILLLPRLNEHDFEILSTPKIIETRNVLLQKLQNKRNVQVERSETSGTLVDTSQEGSKASETQGESIPSGERDVAEIVNATKVLEIDDEENTEQWLEESSYIDTSTSVDNQKRAEDEEDVSFSDLEDDDNDLSTRLSASKQPVGITAPSSSESSDWDRVNETSETRAGLQKARQAVSRDKDSDGESNDWLKVDDFD